MKPTTKSIVHICEGSSIEDSNVDDTNRHCYNKHRQPHMPAKQYVVFCVPGNN